MFRRSITATCTVAALGGAVAEAQDLRTPGHGGIRVGAFVVEPSLEVAGAHDDNVYREDKDEQGDFLSYVRPRLEAHSNWTRHQLDFLVSSDIAMYGDLNTEDYQDVVTELGGRLDVLRDSYLTAQFGFDKLHELRGSPDNVNGKRPTDYRRFRGLLGYTHKFNRLSVGVEHNVRYYDYDDNPTNFGVITNDDRDRYHNISSLRFGYEIQPGYEAFLRGSYFTTDYDRTTDDNGFRRSSEGYQIDGGMAFDLTGLITGDIFFGYRSGSYDDSRLSDIDSLSGGIDLVWEPTRLTTVTTSLDTGIRETTLIGVSGYFSTNFDIKVDHELRRNIILSAYGGYSRNDYEGNQPGLPEREEDIYRLGFAATYLLNRYFYMKGSYDYIDREVNIPADDYTVNRFIVSFGARM